MSEQIISLGILSLLTLFAFFGAIWGVIRGLRKTVWRGVWLLLTAVVLFFTAGLIVDAVFYANVSFLNLTYNGKSFTTFHGMLMEMISANFDLEATPVTPTQIIDLSKLILNSVIFTVLFLVLKYLLLPFNALTYKWFFRSKEERIYHNKLKQYKVNEQIYRLHVKNFKQVIAHGFADDFIEYEENLKEIKENKKASSLELLKALKERVDKKTAEAQIATQTPKEREAIKKLIEGEALPSQLKTEIEKEKKIYAKEKEKKDLQDLAELEKEEELIERLEREEREREEQERRKKEKLALSKSKHRPGEVIPADKYIKDEESEEEEKEEFVPTEEYQPKKEEQPEITRPVKPTPPRKRRLAGMLVGAIVGLFICAMTLTPITGVLNLAVQVNKRSAAIINEDTENGLLYAALSGDGESNIDYIRAVLDAYEKSATSGVLKYTGVNAVSLLTFNVLSNIKINDVTVNIVEDILRVLDLAIEGKEFSENIATLSTDLTREELEVLISDSKSLVEKTFEVQVVKALGDNFLPTVEEYAQKIIEDIQDLPFGNKAVLADMVTSVFENVIQNNQESAVENIKNDLLAFIEILESLNENIIENNQPTNESVLTILLRQNFSRDKDRLVNFLTTNNNAQKIFSKLLNTKIISSVLPHITYSLVEYLTNIPGFEFDMADELSEFKRLQISDAILSIISEGLSIFKTIDLSKGFDVDNITTSGIISVGKIIDRVKDGLLPTNTYNELLNKVQTIIATNVQGAMGEDINVSKAIHAITNSMQDVESWENEFTVFAEVYNGLFAEVNGEAPLLDLTKDIDILTLDFERVGEKLDLLKTGYLGKTSVLFGGIYQDANDESFEGFFKTNETTNLHLLIGTALENATAMLKADATENDITYQLATLIEGRLIPRVMNKDTSVIWKTELVKLTTLLEFQQIMDAEDGSINMVELGKLLDTFIAKGSVLITTDDVKDLIVGLVTTMKDSLVESITDETIKNAILTAIGSTDESDNGSIIYNLKNKQITSFEKEFSHLSTLLSIDFGGDGSGALLGYLVLKDVDGNIIGLYGDHNEIVLPENVDGKGAELDSILNNADSEHNSQIITKEVINNLLLSVLETLTTGKLDGNFAEIINVIKDRIQTQSINSYEQEFKAIQYLLDIAEYVDLGAVSESELETIGGYFDDISYSILVGDCGSMVLNTIVNEITSQLTDKLNEINSIVDAHAGVTGTSIKDLLLDNINNLDYLTYNFAVQYKEVGMLASILSEVAQADWLDGITIDDIPVMKTNIYNLSENLTNLQNNIVAKALATRYITIYIYSNLYDAMYDDSLPLTPNAEFTDYVESFGDYLKNNVNETIAEVYWDTTWDGEEESVAIDPAFDKDNIKSDDFHYALIKIINSFESSIGL